MIAVSVASMLAKQGILWSPMNVCVCVFARSMQSRIVSEALHEQSNEPNSKSSSANIKTKQEK